MKQPASECARLSVQDAAGPRLGRNFVLDRMAKEPSCKNRCNSQEGCAERKAAAHRSFPSPTTQHPRLSSAHKSVNGRLSRHSGTEACAHVCTCIHTLLSWVGWGCAPLCDCEPVYACAFVCLSVCVCVCSWVCARFGICGLRACFWVSGFCIYVLVRLHVLTGVCLQCASCVAI